MNEELKRKLGCWKVDPTIPGEFQREVWQRIAIREAARQEPGFRQNLRRFFEMLATPRYATATLVTALAIGAAAAHMRTNQDNARVWNDIQMRYAISIDPAARAFRR